MNALTIYLFDEDVSSFDDLLRDTAPPDVVPDTARYGFTCRLYRSRSEHNAPNWASYLDEHIPLSWDSVVAYSATLLVHTGNRYFAVTFNRGSSLLRVERAVPDFGRRVCGNGMRDGGMRGLRSQTVGAKVRRSKQALNFAGKPPNFRFEPGTEVVRGVRGDSGVDFATTLDGADSLRLTPSEEYSTLPALGRLLTRTLECYARPDYRQRLPILADYELVPKGTALDLALSRDLMVRLRINQTDDISAAVPEALADAAEQVGVTFHITRLGAVAEVTVHHAVALIQHVGEDALRNTVYLVDADGGRHVGRSLLSYLSAEAVRGDQRYVLCDGAWYAVSRSQYGRVEHHLAALPERELHVDLPMRPGEHERDYNQRLADRCQWLNLDRMLVHVGSAKNRIEVCDLLTPDLDLVFVKKLERSSTLSHLFAQGTVSAGLYYDNLPLNSTAERCAAFVLRQHERRWPGARPTTPTFVYAIATHRPPPLTAAMPFFSRANLVTHVKEVRSFGYRVELMRIPRAKPLPEPRGGGQRGGGPVRRGRRTPRRSPGPGQLPLDW
ncbi:MAG: DUF6119 family protein [Thermocrispum sp.]